MTASSPRASAAADQHQDEPGTPLDGDDAAPFFVRALHSFAPETLAGTSSHTSAQQQANSCLSFTAGQVIRCLNRDPSGWWDGELDGRRGWFPSNYTEVLHLTPGKVESASLSSSAAQLLSTIEHNVGLLDNAVRSRRKAHFQPSTACVISSIRTVLSATSALTRDSPVLRQHPSLSSSRKRILSSLAALVNQARKASAPAPPDPPPDQDERDAEDAQDMLRIARETLASVRAFLVGAEEKGVPVDLALAAATPASVEAPAGRGSEASTALLRAAKSMGNLRAQRRPTPGAAEPAPAPASAFPARPPKAPSRSTTAAAFDDGHLTLRSASALSLHLSTLHDSLLSTIAALIGHVHSHARSNSPASSFAHLIDLTREGIERVRDVLVVVEKVAARLTSPSPPTSSAAPSADDMQTLAAAREKLYEATTALVAAARTATSPREGAAARKCSNDSTASVELARERKRLEREHDDDERQALLGAATGVLRAGGDCVGAVRGVVQQLAAGGEGAFELTLPRPKSGDELAEEHRRGEEAGRAGAAQDGEAVDDSPAGSVAFADADEDAGAPSSSVSAEAEQRAVARPPLDRVSPRKGHSHTLSMLGRKATSLRGLRGRYEGDGGAASGVAALTLEEAQEPEEDGTDRRDEDGESACTGDSEQTASSPVLPRPASFASTYSPVDDDGRRRSIKTSTSSLSPVDFASSPAPSSPSFPEHHVMRPTSLAMHRGKSSESAHSASSSRATAHSLASSSAVTSGTAETSPRSSMQGPPSLAAALLKTAPRTSLGSVNEGARTSPSSSPNATPRGSVSSGSTSATWFLERDYLPQEISFNADGHVSGGTLRCLVERMTLHDTTIDAAFSNTFLLCFRMFTTPLDLANLLWARFDLVPPRHPNSGADLSVDELKQWTAQKLTPVRLRIFNLFKTWVESYWLHGPDGEIVDGLLEWCAGRLKAAMPSASTRLADLVRKRVVAAQQDEAAAIAAKRESGEDFALGLNNGSSSSLASRSASPSMSMSMNGSTPSLGSSNAPPVAAVRNGFAGGGLNRMQSTDRLKAGKALVPFSSLTTGSSPSSSSSSSPAIDAYSPSAAAASSAPPPVVTKSLVANLRPALSGRRSLLSSVTEIDALELARQLTIMESRVYCLIRADELLGAGNGGAGAGSSSGKHVSEAMRTPNVRKMSSLSTRLTGWITEAILGEQDQKRRTGLLKYFIKLGERLLHLANYNALFAVFTALNSSTISRLRKTWDGLAPKYRSTFETLRKATDHGRNYAEYRQKVRQAVPPCLPFVGLFLTDLIFVFEGNRAERPSPADPTLLLINFDRYHKMARIVGELQRFQSPYSLVEVPEMQAYLSQELEGLKRGQDAQSLYRQSLMIEPRQGGPASSSAASIISSQDSHRPRDIFNWRG
ncbi:hypothetical protein JCM9279_001745 [Rhodotorula babjevae]